MKKQYLLFSIFFFTLFTTKLEAQVPNGGFENWENNLLYSDLAPYFTSNLQSFITIGQANVTEVPGVNGSAVRLESVTDGNNIVPGAMILADIVSGSAGWPFASQPDSITGDFRYNIPSNDTAIVFILFYFDGIPFNTAEISLYGNQNDFTYQAFEIPNFFFTPDSISALIYSTNINNPVVGGWLEMDNLTFSNSEDQLPNNGFDNWDDIQSEDPVSWATANYISALTGSPVSVSKTDDAYAGDYALRLETVEISFFGNDPDTVGYTSTGIVDGDEGIEGGFPYTEQPDKLTGYYKYTPSGNDTAVINLIFTKYNSGTGETDELMDYILSLPPASGYTEFEIPISLGEAPDTANITIGSSNYADEENFIGIGSVLLIDELVFEFADGTKVPLFSDEAKLFPNPASDYTALDLNTVDGEVKSIQLYDITGRVALQIQKPAQFGNVLNIDTHNLPNGIYGYLIKTDKGDYSGKLQIER